MRNPVAYKFRNVSDVCIETSPVSMSWSSRAETSNPTKVGTGFAEFKDYFLMYVNFCILCQHTRLNTRHALEVNRAKNLDVHLLIDSPLIFVRFTSNFLCMCSDIVASTYVIMMTMGNKSYTSRFSE